MALRWGEVGTSADGGAKWGGVRKTRSYDHPHRAGGVGPTGVDDASHPITAETQQHPT